MRRWLGNKLILLAYSIEPKLKAELNEYMQRMLVKQAEFTAQEATMQLLAHQQQAAQIAMRQ